MKSFILAVLKFLKNLNNSLESTDNYNHGQYTWKKVKKSSKIGLEQKTLISAFAYFLTTITKMLFLKRILGTRIYLHLI